MSFFQKLFSTKRKQAEFSAGDIFYTHSENQYHLFKLLAIDPHASCFHTLVYSPMNTLPANPATAALAVSVYHAPFDKHAFEGATLLVNTPVRANDLIGYHEYLRQTQKPKEYIALAKQYYQAGHTLTDEKKHEEAIDAYSKAIDLLPQFFEAIDNRAFCKMDLAQWKEALEDFRLSLQQNPNNFVAQFSSGECLFRLGDLHNARQQFERAEAIDPNHAAPKQFLKIISEKLAGR